MKKDTNQIQYIRQRTGYYCGPASLEMAFGFFRKHATQDHLARRAKTTKARGTTTKAMINVARKAGFHVYANDRSTIEELQFFLRRGFPVIIDFIEPSSDEGHYALVAGMEKGKIVLHDPWNGDKFALAIPEFERRWHDRFSDHPRWMMAVSEIDFCLGKQYHPTREPEAARRHRA